MPLSPLPVLLVLALPAALAVQAGEARFRERAATPATLAALRKGGYVLYLRHGRTDNTRVDRYPKVDLADCATQRPLTEEGRRMSAQVGEALRLAGIPVGEVHASPLCRARESALAAFGPTFVVEPTLGYTANLTTEEKVPVLTGTRELLSRPVAPGRNRVLVGHAPTLMDLMGYFPKESTLAVFRPLGAGRFRYVASVAPEAWSRLAGREGGPRAPLAPPPAPSATPKGSPSRQEAAP